jgi:hypothetical protein
MTNPRETQAFVRHWYLGVLIIACTLGFVAPSLSATIVIHYCTKTQHIGIYTGDKFEDAAYSSWLRCSTFARDEDCCEPVGDTDRGCIAIAVAPDGRYGIGKGDKSNEALSRAVEACPRKGCIAQSYRCVKDEYEKDPCPWCP